MQKRQRRNNWPLAALIAALAIAGSSVAPPIEEITDDAPQPVVVPARSRIEGCAVCNRPACGYRSHSRRCYAACEACAAGVD